VPVDRAPVDKDESDTELAVRAALDRRRAAIAILGALGGPRLDHALANSRSWRFPELRGVDVRLIAAEARVRCSTPADVGRAVRPTSATS
jgi:thiamine pyrophosphokinase